VAHHFQVNLRGMIELLSNHLYGRREVFLRELLQNAADAITARQQQEPGFRGEIQMEVTAARGKPPTLMVSDNGVGLTEEELHRFVATIGATSKRDAAGKPSLEFLGQFGIGLLSSFVVSDEIVMVSRSLHGGPAVEWRGHADGTYTVRSLSGDLAPGTQVYVTCRVGAEELFDTERVAELAAHYGGLLPHPIRVISRRGTLQVNEEQPPWRQKYGSEMEQRRALLRYGRRVLGRDFLDAIVLRAEAGGIDGVAFVLPEPANLVARRSHRVYLKDMLLSEAADNLLPDWAFFVKAVVNARELRPTASRESFYEDERLAAARDELGSCLRKYLLRLAERESKRFEHFLSVHSLALKALAAEDEECYRTFIDWLPFDTSQGRLTGGELRRRGGTIRYVDDVAQYEQMLGVASAQGILLVNAGYVYEAELIAQLPHVFHDVQVELVEPAELVHDLQELDAQEQLRLQDLLAAAEQVLRRFRCMAEVRKFLPAEVPCLYLAGSEARFLRSLEQAREVADPLFAGVLGSIASRHEGASARVCLNLRNPLVQRLAQMADSAGRRHCLEVLYVQALLHARQPLSTAELALLSDGLVGLMEWGTRQISEKR
jgi:molecular chaperone HtpG